MDRKAAVGEGLIFIWLFFLIILALGSVAAAAYIFFGGQYDFRQVSADILNYRIKECLSEKNITLDNKTFSNDFYKECRINQNVTEENFFVNITVDDQTLFDVGPGDPTQCALSDKNENYPRCQNSTIIKNNKKIFIQTGNNQFSREVAL